MPHPHRFLLPFILILSGGHLLAQPSSPYTQEIESWHRSRINNLKAANGWLNLAGLFWLNEGKNSFGSDAGNAIIFLPGHH
jgi:pyrroloquinoline quinone (PQQ) biosynthesis protein C